MRASASDCAEDFAVLSSSRGGKLFVAHLSVCASARVGMHSAVCLVGDRTLSQHQHKATGLQQAHRINSPPLVAMQHTQRSRGIHRVDEAAQKSGGICDG